MLLCWTCLDFSVFLQQTPEPLHTCEDHSVWAAFCTLLFPSSSHCFIVIPFAVVISRGCSPWCSRPPPQGMPVLGWRVWFRGMKPPPPPSSQPSGAVCSLLLLGIPVLRLRNLSQCSSQAATPPNESGHRIMEWLWDGRDGHMLAPVSVPLCCWSGAKKL